jgi:hypothetical protein
MRRVGSIRPVKRVTGFINTLPRDLERSQIKNFLKLQYFNLIIEDLKQKRIFEK